MSMRKKNFGSRDVNQYFSNELSPPTICASGAGLATLAVDLCEINLAAIKKQRKRNKTNF